MNQPFNSNSSEKWERNAWFEKGKSLEKITDLLQKTKQDIRIASGFFTIKGWGLIRKYTRGKKTYLLVGLNEPGEERARMALVQEMMRDLRKGLDRERRASVRDLIQKMQSQEFEIVDARATDHHAKLYIGDDIAAIIASSNLTGQGLNYQIEAGNIITEKKEVVKLIQEFDSYFNTAKDITAELLEILLKWLKFATPWDVYLKTMLAFENIQQPKSRYSKKPVSYQVDMIAQTLQQIRDFSGSMLVASTGLGKTVVAVHVALHLKEEDLIDNVMVIGPKAVRNSWRREMREAGLSCDYFVRQTFDKKDATQDGNLELFEEIKETLDRQRWLLIIDESHEFRNRFKQDLYNRKNQPKERLSFVRLREFVKKGNSKALLLTGSPYARDVDNINNQLYLLPHTAESKALLPDYVDDDKAWFINDTDEFIKIPVASQLTTPHVAKYYGKQDELGTYISFGQQEQYIPEITLHCITFPLHLEKELTKAITDGYFKLNSSNAMLRELFNRLVKIAWTSSPLALQGVLESIADTPGGKNSYKEDLQFLFPRVERQKVINPIIKKLQQMKGINDDIKLQPLLTRLNKACSNSKKVVIFCERRATVVYLVEGLKKLLPSLKVTATVEYSESENKFELKETKEIEKMLEQFAPTSNNAVGKHQETYDVFISTDAYSAGVNMQDASIVINYDIDWIPIGPIQRAGRILRLWHSPRTIEIYTFVPFLKDTTKLQDELINIDKRWNNLMERHQESKKIIDLPVLTTADSQEIKVSEIASEVRVESGQIKLDSLADFEISPIFKHTAQLQLNRDYAESLPDDLISAKIYHNSEPSIYLLLIYNEKYYGIIYNPITEDLREPSFVNILDSIACEETTETAEVDYDKVEKLSHVCIQKWCDKNEFVADDVERICTLYLIPDNQKENLEDLLKQSASIEKN